MGNEPTVRRVPEDERVEVVDADGTIVGVVMRSEMRAANLRHRGVGVVVRRPGDGAVLAHRRAAWKDVWPGRWDLAFGGVCDVGEGDVDAAVRELAEEAGVEVAPGSLRRIGTGSYEDDAVSIVGTVFEIEHGGPFTFADGEVEATEWVQGEELEAWVDAHPHCPDTIHILREAGHLLRTIEGPWPDEP
jgi:8-oxo-dGTP pyrophosphatase MutT (NUDIX family)